MNPQLPWQVWLALGVPSVLAIIGILLNQSRLNSLEATVTRRIERIEDKIDALTALLRSEVKDLLNMIGDLGQRVVRLEEKQKKQE